MPVNDYPEGVKRPSPIYVTPPPPIPGHVIPSPPSYHNLPKPPPMRVAKKITIWERVKLFAGFTLIVGVMTLLAMGVNQSLENAKAPLGAWAKAYDAKHCAGNFDTAECRNAKEAVNAKAYRAYKESTK